jgi:XapX domain-containing protein
MPLCTTLLDDRRKSTQMVRMIEGSLEMKVLLISFVVGLLVGVVSGVIRVKSPAPPIVALLGLFGMVLGEQAGGWLLTKKIRATNVASAQIVSDRKDQQQCPKVQSVILTVDQGRRQWILFSGMF